MYDNENGARSGQSFQNCGQPIGKSIIRRSRFSNGPKVFTGRQQQLLLSATHTKSFDSVLESLFDAIHIPSQSDDRHGDRFSLLFCFRFGNIPMEFLSSIHSTSTFYSFYNTAVKSSRHDGLSADGLEE